MSMALPGESREYRAARDRLLEQEIELRRATEAVAVARRELPPGGQVKMDYVFQGAGEDGAPKEVRLSELFAPGKDSLVIYSFMFPRDPGDPTPGPPDGDTALLPLAEGPCPSCVGLLDQLDGAAEHASQHVNLVVVAKAPLSRVLAFGRERGWRRLRLLSSAGNTYNTDYFAETPEGIQRPMLTVFHRDGDVIRHFWSSELLSAPTDPGQEPRHVGTLEPLWNLLDLTPEGRPAEWAEQFSYTPQEQANDTPVSKEERMDARIEVVTLAVSDLDRGLAFYRDGLGLESRGILGTEFVGDDVVPAGALALFELRGGLLLALYPRTELAKDANIDLGPPKTGEFSLGHAVSSKREVDALLARAEAAGAALTDQPHDRPWGIYSGYFRDPDGHLWEVLWNPRLTVNGAAAGTGSAG